MAINQNLLIAAPMLQDYFVDNATGAPMSAGIVTCYRDDSRTTLKNWYYQSGTPGNYNYITLDNPLTLSAVGTIVDPNGQDTIPFFYPVSELDETEDQPYYITVVDSNGQQQCVRQNFPFNRTTNSPITTEESVSNLVVNNIFWNFNGTYNGSLNTFTASLTNSTSYILAPSQHGGMLAASTSDIRWIKNITGGQDTLTLTPFGNGNTPLSGDITPEFYVNVQCANSQAGETQKCIQIPISLHINSLENTQATVTIQAQNIGTNNTISLDLVQFLGSGAIGTSPITTIGPSSITLTNSWQKYIFTFTFPSSTGLTVGNGGDDGIFLQINFPLSKPFNINICKPSIYASTVIPTNDFQSYDQIDSKVNSPRTGDIRVSLNNFSPYGWVAMNDGSIGSGASGASTLASIYTWNLYYLIWNSVGITYAPMVDSMPYGVSAYADFTANRALYLTKQLGRVLASLGIPSSGTNTGTNWALGQTTGNEQATLSLNQIPNHTHNATSAGGQFIESGGSSTGITPANANASVIATTGNITGYSGQTALVMQPPTVYYNVFIKL